MNGDHFAIRADVGNVTFQEAFDKTVLSQLQKMDLNHAIDATLSS